MNGDLSRITFNPLKHFTRVVIQQGRVQLDADGNEQTSILLHLVRTLAADLIGQHGGPDDLFALQNNIRQLTKRNCGFAIIAAKRSAATGAPPSFFPSETMLTAEEKEALENMITNGEFPLQITGGHYYVDGILCENERPWRYLQQPDLRQADEDQIRRPRNNGTYLLYLDVWERHITSLEDPSIREVALGGADTTARTKIVWQVKVSREPLAAPTPATCEQFDAIWPDLLSELQPANRGRMQADAKPDDTTDNEEPCISSPEARFRGLENQLYRVEVHRGGPAWNEETDNDEVAATFKWSRDNATIAAALKRKRGDELIVSGLRDFSRWFTAGDWVEITHDALELNGLPGTMARLVRVEGESLTIDPQTATGPVYEPGADYRNLPIANVKVRRWDHRRSERGPLRGGAILIKEGRWIELEDGVKVRFEPPNEGEAATRYRTGDYWLVPARVSTGDVEWPTEYVPDTDRPGENMKVPVGSPPHGVEHHYAPLATILLDRGEINSVLDLRHKFPASGVCGA